MNIAQQYSRFNLLRHGTSSAKSNDHDPWEKVFPLFGDAGEKINEALSLVHGTSEQAVSTDPAAFSYDRPGDLLNDMIEEGGVQFIDPAGRFFALERLDEDMARQLFGNYTNPTRQNQLTHWWIMPDGSIGIGWPPAVAGTLRFTYTRNLKSPSSDVSIYAPLASAAKATFTKDSATVSFPTMPLAGQIEVGFEIGAGSLDILPTDWYRVKTITLSSLSIASITVDRPFRGQTKTGVRFVASEVSEIELVTRSTKTALLPVWWAMSQVNADPNEAVQVNYEQRFYTELAGCKPSQRGSRVRRVRPATIFAHFGVRGMGSRGFNRCR